MGSHAPKLWPIAPGPFLETSLHEGGRGFALERMMRRLRLRLKKYWFLVDLVRLVRRMVDRLISVRAWHIQRSYTGIMAYSFELTRYRDLRHLRINEIEINKNCNLNCIMCNTQLSTRKQKNLEPDFFEQLLTMMKRVDHSNPLPLHTIGEPMINPLLEEYLKIARKHKIRIFLSTNAQNLDKKMDIIFRNADVIEILRFSVDGATKETYEKIRVPGKFDRLINNLDLFIKENKNGRYLQRRRMTMSSIVSTDVQHELAYHLHFYSKYLPMENIGLGLVNGLSPDNTYFFTTSILKKHIVPNRPCKQLGGYLQVLVDGRVSACCRDYNGDLIYGNIKENSAEEIVNSQAAMTLRGYHIDNTVPKDILCASCFMIDPRVTRLFELFCKILVLRHQKRWDVDQMQKRFDRFFELFSDTIPPVKEYLSLMH